VLERTVQLQLRYKGTVAPAHAAGARRASGLAVAGGVAARCRMSRPPGPMAEVRHLHPWKNTWYPC